MITLSVMAIGIFSAFMLYDLKRVKDGGETNYITATLGVYLEPYNVFQSLLALLGIAGGTATERRSPYDENGACGPRFSFRRRRLAFARVRRARTPRCSRRGRCAGNMLTTPAAVQR